ncbi:DNA-processing protein DprA [Cognatishimia sp. MH4019]|uniref:DNA-processing protein DprA n=1 Tax=Cognatishimia sp. MH4019 TaxID=2854030 RepID=UPI001CD1D92C|nr:DNA-processing protein DprA [Cognatishimia sp. MH4019]
MTEEHLSSFHPPLPPTTEDTLVAWLRLLRSRRVGVTTFFRLLKEHGTAEAALEVLPDVAKAAGVQSYQVCPEGVVQAELAAGRRAGATLVRYGTPEYPKALCDIPDPPPVFWALGNLGLLNKTTIALVGARNASSLGTRMAKSLSRHLGEDGYVIASGLARGVDTAAHHAALESGTIAVLAGGVDVLYPAENSELAQEIARKGLRISEQPMGLQPIARHFPRRNRIISGLSQAVVVVEAAAKSGSLITARNALDQGRDVFAVPGHPFDARASGCNMLIRDGATLVRGANDVIEALARPAAPELPLEAPNPLPADARSLRDTAALHSEILARIGPSPVAEDQLIRDMAKPAQTVAPVLVDMEMSGLIERQAGGLLARTEAAK